MSDPKVTKLLRAWNWLIAGVLAALTMLHALLGDGSLWAVWFHSLTPYWPLLAFPVLALTLVGRHWDQAALAGFTVVGWLAFNRPPLGADTPGTGPALRVVSANALMVNPDPGGLVDELLAHAPDVLVVQELTPDFQNAMPDGRLPHRIEHPEWHSFGGGIYSRFPITDRRTVQIAGVELLQVQLDVEGRDIAVWNAHTLPPVSGANHRDWLVQVESIARLAKRTSGPLIVAGDFNLTRHHQGYRTLTAVLDDVHRRCGRWTAWTWPNGGVFGLPIHLKLDHVLTRGMHCRAVYEGEGAGSDHRPIVVELEL